MWFHGDSTQNNINASIWNKELFRQLWSEYHDKTLVHEMAMQ